MSPSRNTAPPQRWNGLVSASIDAFREDADPAPEETGPVVVEGTEVDDLISKAAVAVEGHAASAQSSRNRMARLSAESAASLRSAIIFETPTEVGKPSRGVTAGSRLDVQR